MPTYQYRCTACGNDLEAVQSFSAAALTECPTCSGRLRKVFGSIGVVFKGAGFYKTDSRSAASGATKERPKDSTAKDGTAKDGATANASGSASSGSGGSESSTSASSSSGGASSTSSGSANSSSASTGSTSTAAA